MGRDREAEGEKRHVRGGSGVTLPQHRKKTVRETLGATPCCLCRQERKEGREGGNGERERETVVAKSCLICVIGEHSRPRRCDSSPAVDRGVLRV